MKNLIKYLLFLMFLNLVFDTSLAQGNLNIINKSNEINESNFINNPGIVLKIIAVSEIKEFKNYILFRNYKVPGRTSKVMVGFLGFSPSIVKAASDLRVTYKDSSSLPTSTHRLLSDILVKKRMVFDYRDLKSIKIIIFDLSVEKELEKSLKENRLITEGIDYNLYIIWDQASEKDLPLALKEYKPKAIIDVIIASNRSKSEENPKSSNSVDFKPAPSENDTNQHSDAVRDTSIKGGQNNTGNQEAVVNLPPPVDVPANDPVVVKPTIKSNRESGITTSPNTIEKNNLSASLDQLVKEWTAFQKIKNADVLSYTLNDRNDSLIIIYLKEQKKAKQILQIPNYPPLLLTFIQSKENRRGDENDVELADIMKPYSGKFTFKYFNSKLYYETLSSALLIPKSCTPFDKIRIEGFPSSGVNIAVNERKEPTGVEVTVEIPKSPIKFNVLDQVTSKPINDLDILITYKNRFVHSGSYNSGEELLDKLFSLPDIRYKVLFTHSDYSPMSQRIFITDQDFGKDSTYKMAYKPAYNMFYIDLTSGNRMLIKRILQDKVRKLLELKIPFLLFVSNGTRPLICSDQDSFNEFTNKISIMMTLPPGAVEDKDAILNALPLESLAKGENIRFQYFLSSETMRTSSKILIDDLLTEVTFRINKKPEVFLFLDFIEPEEARNREYHYHSISN